VAIDPDLRREFDELAEHLRTTGHGEILEHTVGYGLQGEPLNFLEASLLLGDQDARQVDRTELVVHGEHVMISTAHVINDFGPSNREHVPVTWESMIFGGLYDGLVRRYSSRENAEAGHRELVETVTASPAPDEGITGK
jgi:hypothetical protein